MPQVSNQTTILIGGDFNVDKNCSKCQDWPNKWSSKHWPAELASFNSESEKIYKFPPEQTKNKLTHAVSWFPGFIMKVLFLKISFYQFSYLIHALTKIQSLWWRSGNAGLLLVNTTFRSYPWMQSQYWNYVIM